YGGSICHFRNHFASSRTACHSLLHTRPACAQQSRPSERCREKCSSDHESRVGPPSKTLYANEHSFLKIPSGRRSACQSRVRDAVSASPAISQRPLRFKFLQVPPRHCPQPR